MERKTWTAERTAWRQPREHKEVYALVYDPTPGGRKNEDGTTSHGLRFPALVVTDIVEGPKEIAEKVATELNATSEAQATISRLTAERDGWIDIREVRVSGRDGAPGYLWSPKLGRAVAGTVHKYSEGGDGDNFAVSAEAKGYEFTHWRPPLGPPATPSTSESATGLDNDR